MVEYLQSFADLESAGQRRRSRLEEFLGEIDAIIPWVEWVALVEPLDPDGRRGRRPFSCERMLRMCSQQVWFHLSEQVPDAMALLKFRYMLEREGLEEAMLAELARILQDCGVIMRGGSIVDATFAESPSPSTKNRNRSRGPEAHQSKKGRTGTLATRRMLAWTSGRGSYTRRGHRRERLGGRDGPGPAAPTPGTPRSRGASRSPGTRSSPGSSGAW